MQLRLLDNILLLFLIIIIIPCSNCNSLGGGANLKSYRIKKFFCPFFVMYDTGRVVRFFGDETVPPSLDLATGVASKDVTIDPLTNTTARLYLPNSKSKSYNNNNNNNKLPILVFFHGGGFFVSSAFSPSYHNYLNSLVSNANVLAVSFNYRRPPEHLLPAAYDDSWAALKWAVSSRADPWIREHGDVNRVYMAGDSAGGNIVHNVAMRVGSDPFKLQIEGIVLLDPYFWGAKPIRGETRHPETRKYMESIWRESNEEGVTLEDPWVNPTAGKEGKKRLEGLGCKKALVCVAEKDDLVERGRKYYEDLKESGWKGRAEFLESKGEDHVFFLDDPSNATSLELMKTVVGFINDGNENELQSQVISSS